MFSIKNFLFIFISFFMLAQSTLAMKRDFIDDQSIIDEQPIVYDLVKQWGMPKEIVIKILDMISADYFGLMACVCKEWSSGFTLTSRISGKGANKIRQYSDYLNYIFPNGRNGVIATLYINLWPEENIKAILTTNDQDNDYETIGENYKAVEKFLFQCLVLKNIVQAKNLNITSSKEIFAYLNTYIFLADAARQGARAAAQAICRRMLPMMDDDDDKELAGDQEDPANNADKRIAYYATMGGDFVSACNIINSFLIHHGASINDFDKWSAVYNLMLHSTKNAINSPLTMIYQKANEYEDLGSALGECAWDLSNLYILAVMTSSVQFNNNFREVFWANLEILPKDFSIQKDTLAILWKAFKHGLLQQTKAELEGNPYMEEFDVLFNVLLDRIKDQI